MREQSRPPDVVILGMVAVLVGFLTFVVLAIWQRNADDPFNPSRLRSEPDLPWVADHPALSGLIVFALVLVIGRVWLFMKRLEDRDRL